MKRDTSRGGMLRTGQIPRLTLTRRKPVNVGPVVKEGDLVLILLARQRLALQAAHDALGGDGEGRNRTETEIRKSRLSGLIEMYECIERWLPQVMFVRAAREDAGWPEAKVEKAVTTRRFEL